LVEPSVGAAAEPNSSNPVPTRTRCRACLYPPSGFTGHFDRASSVSKSPKVLACNTCNRMAWK